MTLNPLTGNSMRFHLLGLPHTSTSSEFNACAYTAKILKFARMMAPRGHTITHYGGEGSQLPEGVEHVGILSVEERLSLFGPTDHQRVYPVVWDGELPYWKAHNARIILALQDRVQKGDFILSLAGVAQKDVGDAFPGSASLHPGGPFFVEYGIGYYGAFSTWRCYESHGHREWMHGKEYPYNQGWATTDDHNDAVVPNYFDTSEFTTDPKVAWALLTPEEKAHVGLIDYPFYLYMGRITPAKGWNIAVEVTRDIRARLLIAGQGEPGELPEHARYLGHASVGLRRYLMAAATALFAPTQYREPFGGVAVEAQLSGCPAITSDHGAFVETVDARWRCTSHREYCEAALLAASCHGERDRIAKGAQHRWSLEAVAPQYERYFQRLTDRWGKGWYA